jgi:uncharacterized iron-regulated membrane protein
MLVIRGSINGTQGELRFEPRTNWLKFTAAVGLLFVATIVFLAYVGIEFVIQLGLLIAEWSKNSNSV